MRKYQIQYLLISLIVLVSSCSRSVTKDLIHYQTENVRIRNTYFSNADRDYVYKTRFDIYKHSFGGILIVKKMSLDKHRIVYTSEFGNKIFDFEFNEDEITTNFVHQDLDKKYILNTLITDLKLLVKQEVTINRALTGNNNIYYESLLDGNENYYVFSMDSKKLQKIVSTENRKEKMSIYFENAATELAKKISIQHKNIKLTIGLSLIN